MADFYMHKTLINKIQKAFKLDSPESTIGAQGPDFFYYVLGKEKESAMECGNIVHRSHTRDFLVTMLEIAIKHESIPMRDYLIGFLTHHALDTEIHPYIFYYTGVFDENDASTHKWAGLHLQFERKVDIAFIKHTFHFKPHTKHLAKTVLPLKELSSPVIHMMNEALEKTFSIKDSGLLFNQGYQTMKKVGRFVVFDPFTLKRRIIKCFESRKKIKSNYFQDLSHAQNTHDFDYLNLNHDAWLHPVTGTPRKESVLDIFESAYQKSHAWAQAVIQGFKCKNTEALTALLENASYDTGLPLSENQAMTHFLDYRKKITP